MALSTTMKKQPKKIKQWAKECYESLEKAIVLFREEYPNPSEEDKLELISFAVPFAAMNRGVRDKKQVELANEYVLERLAIDFGNKEEGEPTHHSICFLIAYLDAHIVLGFLSELKTDDIMEELTENYEISIPT